MWNGTFFCAGIVTCFPLIFYLFEIQRDTDLASLHCCMILPNYNANKWIYSIVSSYWIVEFPQACVCVYILYMHVFWQFGVQSSSLWQHMILYQCILQMIQLIYWKLVLKCTSWFSSVVCYCCLPKKFNPFLELNSAIKNHSVWNLAVYIYVCVCVSINR